MDDGSRVCSYTEEDRWQDKAQSDAAEAVEIVVQVSAAHRQGQEEAHRVVDEKLGEGSSCSVSKIDSDNERQVGSENKGKGQVNGDNERLVMMARPMTNRAVTAFFWRAVTTKRS
jgi:hypothetical protein